MMPEYDGERVSASEIGRKLGQILKGRSLTIWWDNAGRIHADLGVPNPPSNLRAWGLCSLVEEIAELDLAFEAELEKKRKL
jgi:hypothetical protein